MLAPIIRRHEIEIDYAPRPQFMPFHNRRQRWAILVCHRRAGKTVAAVNDIIRRAVIEGKRDGRYGFIAPYRQQAKDIAWGYLKRFAGGLLREAPRESDLSVTLLGGQTIRLYGADNPDAIRGAYFDGVILDEFADMRSSLWGDVIRPMLSDRHGWATFIGTPKGKNEFFELWDRAPDNLQWYAMMLKASESGIIDQSELDAAKADMGDDRYEQEFECSFEAAIRGAFYGNELRMMTAEGRVRSIEIDKSVRVHTGWDIGRTDSTAIWFIQCVGRERRLVDYHEESGRVITHYADVLYDKQREHGWIYGEHWFPHDMKYKMIDHPQSRLEQMRSKGIEGEVTPENGVLEGVNIVRKMLNRTYIDPVRCKRGLEALRQYHRAWDDKLKDYRSEEHVDWTNHGCDALRTFAVGFDEPQSVRSGGRDRDRARQPKPTGASHWSA